MAKKEETRAPGLESQVMKGLDLLHLLNHPFEGQKAGAFTSTYECENELSEELRDLAQAMRGARSRDKTQIHVFSLKVQRSLTRDGS